MVENLAGLTAILGLWVGLVAVHAVGFLILCLAMERKARLLSIFGKHKAP